MPVPYTMRSPGELLYYEGMVQDITGRNRAEEERQKAEEHLARYAEELRFKNAQLEVEVAEDEYYGAERLLEP